ncbi:class I SAM-dependent methyltransferase [Zunongwangia sp. F363]|uniref:Class I SAM-dependent methyltransferase n=1 Tax=Autumnicola tepida TaxID=3075595 RepID=A0ABU3C9G0_9FLAO|nr:class I SAM-dependent methyltransferase [Zunongwangia sp. F363]MDT0642852.1 class I SAM-dependent methyltransferase [Zunongwangia sp. F363]
MIELKFKTFKRAPFFEIAKQLIKGRDKILDIGAGEGSFADYLQKLDIYLLEGNPASVAKLKKRYKNVFQGKLPDLPYENSFFDLIHISHVIEHLHPDDMYKTLKEMDRCCKPGGAIVVSTPLFWSGFYNDLSHIKPYDPLVLEKYFGALQKPNSTREVISKSYTVERLEYRYMEEIPDWNLYRCNGLVLFLLKVLTFLRRSIYKKYIRTGYTIVLRKAN